MGLDIKQHIGIQDTQEYETNMPYSVIVSVLLYDDGDGLPLRAGNSLGSC